MWEEGVDFGGGERAGGPRQLQEGMGDLWGVQKEGLGWIRGCLGAANTPQKVPAGNRGSWGEPGSGGQLGRFQRSF